MLYYPKARWWTLDDDTSNKAIEQSSNINQRSIHLCESLCLSNRIFPSSKLEWKDIYIKNRSLYNLIFCILWSTPPYLEPYTSVFVVGRGWRTISLRTMAAGIPSTQTSVRKGVDPFDPTVSIQTLFGDLKGRVLQEAIWGTYQAKGWQFANGFETSFDFFNNI